MISIIIPAFNEAKYIKNTLSELKRCFGDYYDVEVIVVNNGSQDDTSGYAREFSWVKVIDLPSPVTVAEARNIGVAYSKGECLSFVDADILVSERWWLTLLDYHNNYFDRFVISGFKVGISKAPSFIELNWFACFKQYSSNYINSGNLICSKKVYDFVNGFDIKLRTGEDVDFCQRALSHGVEVCPNENFKVYHEGYPKTIKSFFLREKWHGIGDLQSLAKFFRSKVAIVSFAVVALTAIMLISLMLKSYILLIPSLLLIFAANAYSIFTRFKITSSTQLLICFFLNYVYFIARFSSIFEVFTRSNRNR